MRGKKDDSKEIVRESPGIGVYAESSLHRSLKLLYAGRGGRLEVALEGRIVDCVTKSGHCVEIQTASFGSIRDKILAIAKKHAITLVHPIYLKKTIVTLETTGEIRSERKSPKKETIFNLFDELVYTPDFIGLNNLSMEFCMLQVREIRVADGKGSWRRKGISAFDREIIALVETRKFTAKKDFRALVPFKKKEEFTNKTLAEKLSIPRTLAGKMTNCLKKAGVIRETGKRGRELLFSL